MTTHEDTSDGEIGGEIAAELPAWFSALAAVLSLTGVLLSVAVWVYGAWVIATVEGFALWAKVPCLLGWLWYGRTFTARAYIWVVYNPVMWTAGNLRGEW